jgi:hypothetical protein
MLAQAEVADLASTVTDKLDFLEVKYTDLSKLQILLLQVEVNDSFYIC